MQQPWLQPLQRQLGPQVEVEQRRQQLHLLQLPSMLMLGVAGVGLISLAEWCSSQAKSGSENASLWAMVGVVLSTTVWVDGLFLAAALLQPNLSGLI